MKMNDKQMNLTAKSAGPLSSTTSQMFTKPLATADEMSSRATTFRIISLHKSLRIVPKLLL